MFKEHIGNIILFATFLVVARYTKETYKLRKESEKQTQLQFRPFLDFWAEEKSPYKVENKGVGPALNVCLITGDKNGNMSILKEAFVLSAITQGKTAHLLKSNLQTIHKNDIPKKLIGTKKLIEYLFKKQINYLCVIYEDIHGNKFASVLSGVGGTYNETIEFIDINEKFKI